MTKAPAALRDLASFGLGAYWANYLIHQPVGTTEPWAWAIAAGLLNLPIVAWLDRRFGAQRGEGSPSRNGTSPTERERVE